MRKCYKKSVPATPLWLSNGSKLQFNSWNRVTGYYATDNDWMQGELQKFIDTKRCGVAEITEAEYEADYVKKKDNPPPPRPLTEIRAPSPPDTVTPRSPSPITPSADAAATEPVAIPMEAPEPSANPPIINQARPRIGRPPVSKNKPKSE